MSDTNIKVKRIILDMIKRYPGSTAGQIYTHIVNTLKKDPDSLKLIKQLLNDKDQSVRKILDTFEKDNIVTSSIRYRSILKEWRLV